MPDLRTDDPVPAPDLYAKLLAKLHPDWAVDADAGTLTRGFALKGFAKATYLANLAAFVSDREGHHADIAFGWGYCRIVYTSHELGRLSERDFACAAAFDRIVDDGQAR